MKKALLIIGCIVGVLLGALLLWKVVIPFIGWVFGCIFGSMSFSFDALTDFFKSLF